MSEESGKVFMDYSHKDGPRIIHDPDLYVSCHESSHSNCYLGKTSSSLSQNRTCLIDDERQTKLKSSESSINCSDEFEVPSHYSQPWYYSQMTREEAQQNLEKYGIIDGVFLVRQSNRNPNSYVLSFVFNWKVHHVQIMPIEEKGQTVLSLDCGKTKFYDLLQLIEFYQLNVGVLPTKLTHFLVHPKYQQQHSN